MRADSKDNIVIVKATDMIGRYVRKGMENMYELFYRLRPFQRISQGSDVRRRGKKNLGLHHRKALVRRRLVLVEETAVHIVTVNQERRIVEVERVVGEVDLPRNQLVDNLLESSPVVLPFAENRNIGA